MKVKIRHVLAALLILHAGWMLLDGVTAVMTGAYVGEALGPWAALVRALGIDPLQMRIPFVVLGGVGISIATLVLAGARRAPLAAAIFGALTLWYAVIGTLLATAILILGAAAHQRARKA